MRAAVDLHVIFQKPVIFILPDEWASTKQQPDVSTVRQTKRYNFEIILRNSSLVFPTLACNLPNSSSSLPFWKSKSSSDRFANCCLSLPAASFQFPLSFSEFI